MPKRKEHILSLSYGKDSLACLGAIKKLNWPLDRIIHVEVWATDKIPAGLPPMMEFKAKADKWVFKNFGIKVEHIRAETTYEQCFYRTLSTGKRQGSIYGFPMVLGAWCNDRLKMSAMKAIDLSGKIQYLGIAADEPERIERNNRPGVLLPLVEAGWDEAYCRKWCEKHGLLSPIYTSSNRGGC